ncbi:MAG: proteasome accessory factor PafA2 family protein [Desulfomonilaceae bacterium]|nr:proteasome accessory factor PafA2 family protein [Desulfomonilaceae bacterium]
MKTRIFGTECEYALMHYPEGTRPCGPFSHGLLLDRMKELTPLLVSSLASKGYTYAGEFLGNGGRFYIDRGGHPEYATPECSTLKDLVAHEKAGERIVLDLTTGAGALLADSGHAGTLRVFKNNTDSFGTTYGGHENYLVTPSAMQDIRALIPFLVTRQVIAGSGKVTAPHDGNSPVYQITQRADFVDRVFSDRTSEVRGIINLRKREIPREGQNRRLHIIVGDSNMSQYAIWLKIGTTSLILRLLEEGALGDAPELSSPVRALKGISRGLNCPIGLKGHTRKSTALDVQSLYWDRARRFCANNGATPDEKEILQQWAITLEGLEELRISPQTGLLEADPGNLKSKLDWVLKLWLIDRVHKAKGIGWDDYRSRLIDVLYHDLDPEAGLFNRCLQMQIADKVLDDEAIERALHEPPGDTRARIRGMIIQSSAGKNVEVVVENWEMVRIAANADKNGFEHPFRRLHRMSNRLDVRLLDPFLARDESLTAEVDGFLAAWG